MSRGGMRPSLCGACDLVHGVACCRLFPCRHGIASTAMLVCGDAVHVVALLESPW